MTKELSTQSGNPRILTRILTINGGSSSIKFALFDAANSLRRILEGGIERIGLPHATFQVKGRTRQTTFRGHCQLRTTPRR